MIGPCTSRRRTHTLRVRSRCGVGATVLLLSAVAQAQQTHAVRDAIDLQPGRCLEPLGLTARATVWLGRDRIDQRVRVQVLETPSQGVDITLKREGVAVAERHLKPAMMPCADLQAAVGLAIALAIDATFLQELTGEPIAAERAAAPPAARPPPSSLERGRRQMPPVPPASTASTAPSASDSLPASDRIRFPSVAGSAMIHGLVGVIPAATLAGSFGVQAGWETLSLQLSGWGTLGRESQVGTGRVDVSMLAGRLDLCARKPMGRWTGVGCAGAIAGRWVARGGDFQHNFSPTLPWGAVTLRIAAQWQVGPFVALMAAFDGFLPFARPRFDVIGRDDQVTASLEAPAAGFGIGVGPVLTFF